MNEVFKVFISLSVSGTILILGIWLLTHLLRHRISKRWQYYIWLLAVLRLLLPFAPETNLVDHVFQKADEASAVSRSRDLKKEQEIALKQDVVLDESGINPVSGAKVLEQEEKEEGLIQMLTLLTPYLWVVWLVAALLLFVRKITIYQSFVRYIKAGRTEVSEVELLNSFAEAQEKTSIKRMIGAYSHEMIGSPLLYGFFHPCVILPDRPYSKEDFYYIALHELTHYKRKDMFYKWLVQLVVCLHWFNPFVYLMEKEIGLKCELSCDEEVIKSLDEAGWHKYGDVLLNTAAVGVNYKESIAAVTLNEGKKQLKERLEAILRFQKKPGWMLAASLGLTVVVGITAFLSGAYIYQGADVKSEKKEKAYNFVNTCSDLDDTTAQAAFGEIQEIIITSQQSRGMRVENFVGAFTNEKQGKHTCTAEVIVEADWTETRNPLEDPLILGMQEAMSEFTDEAKIAHIQAYISGYLAEMNPYYQVTERIYTLLKIRYERGENADYEIFCYEINTQECNQPMRQYYEENYIEDAKARKEEGKRLVYEEMEYFQEETAG